jgi:thioredoxin 1
MEDIEQIKERKLKEMMEKATSAAVTAPGRPVIMTDGDFEEMTRKYNPVVVDCWAEWCAPCRIIAPIVEDMAKKYEGKIAFGKLDVDNNPKTAMEFGIMAIPTLLFLKNGKEVGRIVGAVPKSQIESKIAEVF